METENMARNTQTSITPAPATPAVPSTPAIVLETEQSVFLANGTYNGVITGMEVRSSTIMEDGAPKTVQYLDFVVRPNGTDIDLTYGVPARVTAKSDLGALMTVFGHPPAQVNQKNDLSAIFQNKKVAFVVQQQPGSKGGSFSTIVKGSLRPAA